MHYPIPPHLQAAYSHLGISRGSLPIAERLADKVISLPISTHHFNADIDAVIATITGASSNALRT